MHGSTNVKKNNSLVMPKQRPSQILVGVATQTGQHTIKLSLVCFSEEGVKNLRRTAFRSAIVAADEEEQLSPHVGVKKNALVQRFPRRLWRKIGTKLKYNYAFNNAEVMFQEMFTYLTCKERDIKNGGLPF
jgi:hypothetical protein